MASGTVRCEARRHTPTVRMAKAVPDRHTATTPSDFRARPVALTVDLVDALCTKSAEFSTNGPNVSVAMAFVAC